MKSKHFLMGLIAVSLAFARPVMADVVLQASGDTYISSTSPTTNFGGSTTLLVGGGDSTLVRFDLSSLSGQPLVTQATLSIWVIQVNTGGGVDVFGITSSWTELGMTFNTQPTTGALLVANAAVFPSSGFYESVDITSEVQSWQTNPAFNNGVEISAALAAPSTNVVFASRENSAVNEPPILTLKGVSSPVPEPSSIVLLGTGLIGGIGVIRRKVRR